MSGDVSQLGSGSSVAAHPPAPTQPMPARRALDITIVLAFSGSLAGTLGGTIERVATLVVMWVLAFGLLVVRYHPRATEGLQQTYLVVSWFLVSLSVLYAGGLRGGPLGLLVSLALTGLFFGARKAIVTLVLGTACIGFAGVADVLGWWHPQLTADGKLAVEWTVHVVLFLVVSTMLTGAQAATLARARMATARARQFALAVEHTDRAVFVLDADGALTWVNDAFLRLVGRTSADTAGRSLVDVLTTSRADPEASDSLARLRRPTEDLTAEVVVHPRDAEPLWATIELRSLGDETGHSGLLLDMTQTRVHAEVEAVQRAMSRAMSSASSSKDAEIALVHALVGASSVLTARVFRAQGGELLPGEGAISEDPRRATEPLRALLDLPPSGRLGNPDVSYREEMVEQGSIRHVCAWLRLDAPTPGFVEVRFSPDVPGRTALLHRLPELLEQMIRHEQRLAEQARFEALFDRSPDALVLLDARGRIRRCNDAAHELWPSMTSDGPPPWPQTVSDAVASALEQDARTVVRELGWRQESPLRGLQALEASVAPIVLPEGSGVLLSVRDVTARRTAEQALERALDDVRSALSEREVLLKEIHHRVKNNLQIVSSVLSMQSERSTSTEARRALDDSVTRVRSMALIHQQLYGRDDLARVDLALYAKSLTDELRNSLAPNAEVELRAVSMEVEIDRAIPFGLILNELFINALKHGVDADGTVRVRVELATQEDRCVLEVSDDGPGVPDGLDTTKLERSTSLGLRIVAALTRQLRAKLHVGRRGGACFTVDFPKDPLRTP